MTKWKIGLVILGLLSAVGCGDSGSSDGDGTGENGNGDGNTDTTSGANAPTNNGTDDDAGSTGNTAGGETAGGQTAGGQTAGGSTAGSTAGGSDAGSTTGAAGACTNDADTKKLASFDPGATAASCGMMCLDNASCNSCYEKDANFSQISAPCRTCWVTITRCVADKCVLGGGFPCLTDANSQACADCRTTNCNPDFVKCSGMDPENP